MSRLAYKDLEIVGFDGTVLVECEPVLPIVRIKDSDRYFLLEAEHEDPSSAEDIDSESIDFSTRRKIESLAERGLLTLLREPFPAFANAVIAYVNREFLSLADVTIPDVVYSQPLTDDVFVMAGTNIAIEGLLDTWASRSMDQATLELEHFLVTKDKQFCARAEHLAELAICAASNSTLRARIYMRDGLAIMLSDLPERLDNFYRTSVHPEFKDWGWEGFQEQLRRLADVLKLRANYLASAPKEGAAAASRPSAQGDSSELSELIKLSAATREIRDDRERYAEATANIPVPAGH
jgi:hypothetical protein